jgi:phospholipase/carboxylesterase
MNIYKDIVTIDPTATHQVSIIWLHGLGADGYDFVDIVPQLHLPAELGIKFIFPNAPMQPVTLNGGFKMRAWFDIYDLDKNAKIDEDGIQTSIKILESLIAAEKNSGILNNNIILAGFSQGAAIVLRYILATQEKFAGALAISGFLPTPSNFKTNKASTTPIFMVHGDHDNVIPIFLAKESYSQLNSFGCNAKWRSYPTEHGLCHEEIVDIAEWIKLILTT